MAATVEFSESNGLNSAESVTDGISNINFGTADTPNITTTSHPIIIGGYSYAKWLRFHVSDMGGSSSISKLRFYKQSGVYVTGETIGGNPAGSPSTAWYISTYAHAINGGSIITTPYAGDGSAILGGNKYSSAGLAIPTSLPASENVLIGTTTGGSLSAPGYSSYMAIGLATTASTPSGAVNQKVFAMTWDEV